MTSDYFNDDPAARTSSSPILTREKMKEMMDNLRLPQIEKPFLQNYLGKFPKFEYKRAEHKPFKMGTYTIPIIMHNAYYPFIGIHGFYRANKVRKAARILLKAISKHQMEKMCDEV